MHPKVHRTKFLRIEPLNIRHPTSNLQCASNSSTLGGWALNVECLPGAHGSSNRYLLFGRWHTCTPGACRPAPAFRLAPMESVGSKQVQFPLNLLQHFRCQAAGPLGHPGFTLLDRHFPRLHRHPLPLDAHPFRLQIQLDRLPPPASKSPAPAPVPSSAAAIHSGRSCSAIPCNSSSSRSHRASSAARARKSSSSTHRQNRHSCTS